MIKTIVRKNWLVKSGLENREMEMMVTPKVVAEVRNYFNCSELEGAELENQGEEGTALTHWEKRVFEVGTIRRQIINNKDRIDELYRPSILNAE